MTIDELVALWRQQGGAEDEIQATAGVMQLALEEKSPLAQLPPRQFLLACHRAACAVRRALDDMRTKV